MVSARHSGNIGDLYAALPCLKEYHRKTGKKVTLYLWENRKAFYYQGATHPVQDKDGQHVMLNRYMTDMAIPLLNAQGYIEEAKIWDGEKIDINLDSFRDANIPLDRGTLSKWYTLMFPDLACDLSEPYITVPGRADLKAKGKIIVARSERYLNPMISYHFLKQYENVAYFAGTKKEHEIFCNEFNLHIPYLEVENFLHFAQEINSCKLYLSNQSSGFQIAEGLKVPRILEVCLAVPNVIPAGKNAFDFCTQKGLQYYVEYLFNK